MKMRSISILVVTLLLLVATMFAVQAETTENFAVMAEEGNAIAASAEQMSFPSDGSAVTQYCPACKKEVKWVALTDVDTLWVNANNDGVHAYMVKNCNFAGDLFAIYAKAATGCLHLNGKTITVQNQAAIAANGGTVNVMGKGTVIGNRSTTGSVTVWTTNGGTVNLYGGTYKKGADASAKSATIQLNESDLGTVNMYGNTVIDGSGGLGPNTSGSVYLNHSAAQFNMYGGTICGGGREYGGNVIVWAGTFAMHGGTIRDGYAAYRGGNVYAEGANAKFVMTGGALKGGNAVKGRNVGIVGTAEISGGSITGDGITSNDLYVFAGGKVTLSGTPVIEQMILPANQTVTVGVLSEGADIAVKAESGKGVLSSNAGLERYAQYFRGYTSGDSIIPNKQGYLAYAAAKLSLTDNVGWCPVCSADVTWTNLAGGKSTWWANKDGMHGYLSDNKTYTGADGGYAIYVNKNVCLHLNGKNITVTDNQVTTVNGGTLNIMGTGTVTGNPGGLMGAAIHTASNGTVNLYGGTYTKGAKADVNASVIFFGGSNNGTVNIYGDTVIDGAKIQSTNWAGAIYMKNAGAYVNMYDGMITGGSGLNGGNINIHTGAFTMYGGVISEGSCSQYGGNVYVDANGSFTMYGGKIEKGTASWRGGNVYVNTNGTFKMQGGNISRGQAAKGPNLCVVGKAELSGGTVAGFEQSAIAAGSAIYVDGGALTLSGNASAYSSAMQGNIYVANTGSMKVEENWTGKASVAFQSVTSAGYGTTLSNGSSTGNFTGTLVNEYETKPNIFGVNGKLVIAGAQLYDAGGVRIWAVDNQDAVAKNIANSGSYIKLMADGTTFDLPADQKVYIDFNGKTANITGSGILCGMDSTNDAYVVSSASATVADSVTVQRDVTGGANGYCYVALVDNGTATFHRLDMQLTDVTLRTAACGIYYKAKFECDSVLANQVGSYGVVFSVNNMPGADFMTETGDINLYTTLIPGDTFGNGTVATSGSVFNIMKKQGTGDVAAKNARRGEMQIYASPYICLNADENQIVVQDNDNAGKTTENSDFDGVAYSLHDVLNSVDKLYSDYAENEQKQIDQFYLDWAAYGMAWDFVNIGKSKTTFGGELSAEDAVCPVCKEQATWIAINDETTRPVLENGGHYYLAKDIVYEGTTFYLNAPGVEGAVVCVHLNGKNLTATKTNAVYGSSSVINIMGDGIVTGYSDSADKGAALQINNTVPTNGIHLYSGTYAKTEDSAAGAPVMKIRNNGGAIKLYEGVKILGGDGQAVFVGTALNRNADLEIYGATIEGSIYLSGSASTSGKTSNLVIDGGNIDAVDVNAKNNVTLFGDVVIGKLNVAAGEKLTLGELSEKTSIVVSATGTFTKETENAETYVKYFTTDVEGDWILVKDGALYQGAMVTETDAAQLNALYANRVAYHGEMHDHTSSGGYSDGHYTPAQWKEQMAALDMDFATIVDHHQASHMERDDWDESIFIGGSEAATTILGEGLTKAEMHYNMIFTDPEALRNTVKSFPEYNYNPNAEKGEHFTYPGFYKERLTEVATKVRENGGLFVHVHPKSPACLNSNNPLDYYFGDETGVEITTGTYGNMNSDINSSAYKLWTDLLALGKRVWATAGSDKHDVANTSGLTTIYAAAENVNAENYLNYMRSGDFAPGWVGIRMAIGDVTMGGKGSFAGNRVIFSIGDFHSSLDLTHEYRVELYDDKGVVFEAAVDTAATTYFAYDAGASAKFYRVVVWDDTEGVRVGVGNPIWNSAN